MESIFSIYIYIYIRYILNKNHIIFSALLYFVTFIELNNAFHTRQDRTCIIIQATEMRKELASVRKSPPVATTILSTSLTR